MKMRGNREFGYIFLNIVKLPQTSMKQSRAEVTECGQSNFSLLCNMPKTGCSVFWQNLHAFMAIKWLNLPAFNTLILQRLHAMCFHR